MRENKPFPFYLRRSFYIHSALVLLTLAGGKVIISKQEAVKNENLKLIQASVRVDLVAMPKYTLEELKAMTPEDVATTPAKEPEKVEVKAEEPKPIAKNEPKEDFKAKMAKEVAEADKHQSFLTKLKQLSDKKLTDKKSKGSTKDSQDLKKLVLAGNKISQGTQTYGDSRGEELKGFDVYVSKLPALVRNYWRLPSFLLDKKLKCRVRVWIAMNGEVTRTDIYQSSGVNEYDQKALEAVKAASPFPQLSEEFGKAGMEGKIVLGFPL